MTQRLRHGRTPVFRPPYRLRLAAAAAFWLQVALLTGSAPAALPGQVSVHPAYPSFFFYHLAGPYFMAGPGDPEGFLYRGTQNPDGTRDGDQQALIDKLAPTGANSIYLMAVRSHGGDGDATENPFVDNDPTLELNEAVLDQWESWFAQMDAAGVTIFFFLYDDGSMIWNTGDTVGTEESDFIRALVDRFEHHRHLIWVVAEEYQERYSPARVSAIAAEIKAADDHDHPVAVHKLSGLSFDEFADDPALDQYAIQYNVTSADQIHAGLEIAWSEALGRYNLNLAEAADWGGGATSREKAWAAAMAGAYVMVYQMDIATTPVGDLEDLGRLRTFMESTDFYTMEPRDDLRNGDTEHVLAREGKSYIVYALQGSSALGLMDFHAGAYDRLWLDIPSGSQLLEQDVQLAAGVQSWTRPAGIGPEAAVYALRTDGVNDVPVVIDQSLVALGTDPLPVTLAFLDPDGPGPHLFTIEAGPSNGTLGGVAPDLTYTADGGFTGVDSFSWSVCDSLDDSAPAAVEITVGSNQPPSADDFSLLISIDTPVLVPFASHASDPDGPEPTIVIVTPPSHGQLTQAGGDWTYTPDSGYSGPDSIAWQADDGAARSASATVAISILAPMFSDDFDRTDSQEIGNGWAELEVDGEAIIASEALTFDALDESDLPLVRRGFARQHAGVLSWRFRFGFRRTGTEGTYAFHMQLGDSASMSDGSPDSAGVAVNLIWGGPNTGLSGHERLGALDGGTVTELATVSGFHDLAIDANLDQGIFSVHLDGAPIALDLPFDDRVPINTVRFFADGLNAQNFLDRSIDDLTIEGECGAPDGFELTLSDDRVTTVESFEVCDTITIGPDWSIAPTGDVTLEAGTGVALGNGIVIEAGARLAIE